MRSTVAAVLVAALAATAAPSAQPPGLSSVSTGDIQRLQDAIYGLTGDLSQLRKRDANAARDSRSRSACHSGEGLAGQ